MNFEILNIINFTITVTMFGLLFHKLKQYKIIFWHWKHYFAVMFVIAIISSSQFYTLTERYDAIKMQNEMSKQHSLINDNYLDEYLSENKPVSMIPTTKETENILKYQQLKSKKLANTIENKGQNNE